MQTSPLHVTVPCIPPTTDARHRHTLAVLHLHVQGRNTDTEHHRPGRVPLTASLLEQCTAVGRVWAAQPSNHPVRVSSTTTVHLHRHSRRHTHWTLVVRVNMAHISAHVARIVLYALHIASRAAVADACSVPPAAYCKALTIVRHLGVDAAIVHRLEQCLIDALPVALLDTTTCTYLAGYSVIEQSALLQQWALRTPRILAALDRRIDAYASVRSPSHRQLRTLGALQSTRRALHALRTPAPIELARALLVVLAQQYDSATATRLLVHAPPPIPRIELQLISPHMVEMCAGSDHEPRPRHMSVLAVFEWLQVIIDAHATRVTFAFSDEASMRALYALRHARMPDTVVHSSITLQQFTSL